MSQEEIDLMNEAKALAVKCGELVDKIDKTRDVDVRWLNIGKTDLQKGFMAVIRSVAQPTSF